MTSYYPYTVGTAMTRFELADLDTAMTQSQLAYNYVSQVNYLPAQEWANVYLAGGNGAQTVYEAAQQQYQTRTVWKENAYAKQWAYYGYGIVVPPTPQQHLKDILKARRGPAISRARNCLTVAQDARELRARETLKLVIGDERFRRYLKDGFVSVQNPQSRRVYQIFPGLGFTKVFEGGKLIERLCVHLTSGFPPTDHMIVRYLMVLNNEPRLWQLANKHGIPGTIEVTAPHLMRSLPEIFADLKAAA